MMDEAQREQQRQAKNLDDDGGVVVPKGDEAVPSGDGRGLDARKSLYKKHKSQREQRIAKDMDEHPALREKVDAIEGKIRKESDDPDLPVVEPDNKGRYASDSNRDTAEVKPESPKREEELTDPNEPVTVTINGKQRQVPRRDVDAAGGIENYQLRAASNEAFQEGARMRKEAEAKLREVEAERQRLEQLKLQRQEPQPQEPSGRRVGHDLPSKDGRGEESEFEDMAGEELVEILYSGDRKKAARVFDYLRRSGRERQATTAYQAPPPAQESQRPPDPPQQYQPDTRSLSTLSRLEKQQVDHAMAGFRELLQTRDGFTRVQTVFKSALADPANAHRQAADIARDAASYVQDQMRNRPVRDVLHARQQQKQNLGQRGRSVERSSSPVEPDDQPTRSSVVDRMRKARGQSPMGT